MGTLVGNNVRNAIERRPYVLYSFIGEIPMGGQSIDVEGVVGVVDANRLILQSQCENLGVQKQRTKFQCLLELALKVLHH